jgi:dTDP-glucose 4,6-dehydratase
MRILVTGGAGFIGANFLQRFVPRYPDHMFVNLDKLTYAANLSSLREVIRSPNYAFVQADIADRQAVAEVFQHYVPEVVMHFAAESHVDRSILGPADFIQTKCRWHFQFVRSVSCELNPVTSGLLHHVSTDEVFGFLSEGGFYRRDRHDPSSPYSASKAARIT